MDFRLHTFIRSFHISRAVVPFGTLPISDSRCRVLQSSYQPVRNFFVVSGRRIGGDEKKVETMAKATVAERRICAV